MKSSREEQERDVAMQELDSDFAKLKSDFGQTHESVSFYCLMEFFREMSMRDEDWIDNVRTLDFYIIDCNMPHPC